MEDGRPAPDGATESRTAIVTGASSGIGRSVATTLCKEGYGVTLASRTGAKLDAVADSLAEAGHSVRAVVADLSSEEEILRVAQSHQNHFGRLDVLVNNAGMGIRESVGEAKTKHIDLQLNINLRSMILLIRECLPMLVRSGEEHGRAWIVNTSSAAGKTGFAELATYSAAKHGVVGLTNVINRELAGNGVRSCVFCPGYVDTPLADHMRTSVSGHEMIQPDDLAEALRFLLRLSDHCVVPEIPLLRPGLVP